MAGRAVALRIVQGTTIAARQMQSFPIPKPRPAERLALSTAASQLRAMAEMSDLGAGGVDPEIEAALGALVVETLALVDKVLATDPELAGNAARELPERVHADPALPTKIRF